MAAEYSNPLPPENFESDHPTSNQEQPLTNADFRKFLATPSQTSKSQKDGKTKRGFETPREFGEHHDSAAEKRRKKKSLYAKLKKQEMERAAELAQKYRDRAKERREGKGDYTEAELLSTTADYKTVGPTAEIDKTAAEKRKQIIQESKFLGGDMAHTHLVKGLDFALLQKVRAEITNKEKEEDDVDDIMMEMDEKDVAEKPKEAPAPLQFKTKLAKNIHRNIQQRELPTRNENFLPGRMAYVFTLYDEYAEADDIPTTLMRSKTDCPTVESQITLTTNDIVINKLTQILSYLRQGSRDKHRKRKEKKLKADMKEDKNTSKKNPDGDLSIYDDIGDYQPSMRKSSKSRSHSHNHHKSKSSYFDKPSRHDEYESKKEIADSVKSFVKNINEKSKQEERKPKPKQGKQKGKPLVGGESTMPDSYAECYPSTQYDVSGMADDSDEEADYSKMDQGNKKGPVGRWDFDTQEEYSSYMSQKEAMPKAAFQYGIKMAGGRKTRRTKEQTEKQKLNRELEKINKIIEKRKTTTKDSSAGDYKKPKY